MTPARVVGTVVCMYTRDGHGFAYETCDIPADMTIVEFRRLRVTTRARRSSVLRRFRVPLQLLRTRP